MDFWKSDQRRKKRWHWLNDKGLTKKKAKGYATPKKKRRVPYVTRHFWVYKHILASTCVFFFGHTHTPQDNGEQQIIAKKRINELSYLLFFVGGKKSLKLKLMDKSEKK